MKKRDCTIYVAKTKALISFAVTAKLICVFVFAYAKCRFSHDAAHICRYKHLDLESRDITFYVENNKDTDQTVTVHMTRTSFLIIFCKQFYSIMHNLEYFCLFDLMLYIHGKQLRSCLDGQLHLTTLFLGKPPRSSLPEFSACYFASD